ncbi:transcriptional regulator [Candidatus Gracilibacteria bacterium]|nr:transcriptional regulator [Candidatus Gracilibacteria bacterium]
MNKEKRKILDFIAQNIHSSEEFDAFFTDLLTPKEYIDLLDRVRICQELSKGSTVLQVCEKLGVASATVVRGNRVLKYGTEFVAKLFGKKSREK